MLAYLVCSTYVADKRVGFSGEKKVAVSFAKDGIFQVILTCVSLPKPEQKSFVSY